MNRAFQLKCRRPSRKHAFNVRWVDCTNRQLSLPKEIPMNIIRMFAFAAAVLITALLFGAIAEGSTSEQPIHAATAVHGTAAPGGR